MAARASRRNPAAPFPHARRPPAPPRLFREGGGSAHTGGMSRLRPLLALPLLLAACGGQELRLGDRIGVADPLREPARAAPFEFGDTARLVGNPTASARAAAEIEAFTRAAETDPEWTHPRDALLLPKLRIARREFREALGIPGAVPSPVAIRALTGTYQALERYDETAAVASLEPLGGAAVMARLTNLPRLRRVEEAMQAVAIEVNTQQLGR